MVDVFSASGPALGPLPGRDLGGRADDPDLDFAALLPSSDADRPAPRERSAERSRPAEARDDLGDGERSDVRIEPRSERLDETPHEPTERSDAAPSTHASADDGDKPVSDAPAKKDGEAPKDGAAASDEKSPVTADSEKIGAQGDAKAAPAGGDGLKPALGGAEPAGGTRAVATAATETGAATPATTTQASATAATGATGPAAGATAAASAATAPHNPGAGAAGAAQTPAAAGAPPAGATPAAPVDPAAVDPALVDTPETPLTPATAARTADAAAPAQASAAAPATATPGRAKPVGKDHTSDEGARATPSASAAASAKTSTNTTAKAHAPSAKGGETTGADARSANTPVANTPPPTAAPAATAERVADGARAANAPTTNAPTADATLESTDAGSARRTEAAHASRAPAHASPGARANVLDIAALATKFAARAANGSSRFSIRLDPPELGRVDVRLEVSNDGVAQARLMVERPDALAELARHARSLERALTDAGVDIENGGLSFELAENSGHGAQDQADGEGGGENPYEAASSSTSETEREDARDRPPPGVMAEIASEYGFSVLRVGRTDISV